MRELTIVIKTHNYYDNIDALLLSVFCQSLQNYNIIFVDYNSTDGTFELLQQYEKADSRISIRQTNDDFQAYCANLVNEIDTPYVFFVDAHNMGIIAQNGFNRLIYTLKQTGSDFVYMNCAYLDKEDFSVLPYKYLDKGYIKEGQKDLFSLPDNVLSVINLSIYGKMFTTEFLRNNLKSGMCLLKSDNMTFEFANMYIQYITHDDYLKMLCERS